MLGNDARKAATVACTLPHLTRNVGGAQLYAFLMLLGLARSPAWRVTYSSFVVQGVNQRGRERTTTSTSACADLWGDVWADIGVVRSQHTSNEAACAGVISASGRAGKELTRRVKLLCWSVVLLRLISVQDCLLQLRSRAWRTGLRASVHQSWGSTFDSLDVVVLVCVSMGRMRPWPCCGFFFLMCGVRSTG